MSSSGILSQTLQSLTNIKIEELRMQQGTFEGRKRKILASANNTTDQSTRLLGLLSGIVSLSTTSKLDEVSEHELNQEATGGLSIVSIWRFLDQAHYDPSIPSSLLEEWERKLRLLLDQRTRKLEYADLYARLLTEWLSDPSAAATPPATVASDSASLDGPFEVVTQTRLQQLQETFESYVFKPHDTNVSAINDYLDGLFKDKKAVKRLEEFREELEREGNRLFTRSNPFDHGSLRWCVGGLLKNELLSEQKKTILQEFLQNEVVLTEIADVLNMRYASLQGGSWGTEGIVVEPRHQLNGKYRIMMDEDILQAIFLHYIGITWSVTIKRMLKHLISNKDVWKSSQKPMSVQDRDRRAYFLGEAHTVATQGIAPQKQENYWDDYFLAQLPNTAQAGARGGYDDEDEHDTNGDEKTPLQIRQQLLHQIAAELLIHRCLYGEEFAVVQSDIQWFYTSLSHSTIYAVLRFFGMPESWMSFFQIFLETPLRMMYEGQQESEVRIRKRGVPISHAISDFMAEAVLFVLDLAANQRADGTLLYRMTDDIWIWGDPTLCKDAWKAVRESVNILGLTINERKSGSISPKNPGTSDDNGLPQGDVKWGFLKLEPGTGRWIIDQTQVNRHTEQLKRQLSASKSVFSFIQIWNSCVGRFFKRVFGQPANCFGRGHVNMVLDTHRRIQSQLFNNLGASGDSVIDHLKNIVSERFGVTDVPDGFFYLPEELGGLALCNPFIDYLYVKDRLIKSPVQQVEQFLEDEKEAYRQAREWYEANGGYAVSSKTQDRLRKSQRSKKPLVTSTKSNDLTDSSTIGKDSDGEPFMPMTEFTRYRELTSINLKNKYNMLCTTPKPEILESTPDVNAALRRLPTSQRTLLSNGNDTGNAWPLHLYAPDLLQRFGGLNIVDKGLLPLSVMQMLRSKKVTWQEVL